MSQYHPYQAFGSPMLGSTIVTAPRRQGDGMDQESLLRQAVTSSATTPSRLPSRHTNLTNTQASAVIDINKARSKFIPHEPVKGAVKPVSTPASSKCGAVTITGDRSTAAVKADADQEKRRSQDVTAVSPAEADSSAVLVGTVGPPLVGTVGPPLVPEGGHVEDRHVEGEVINPQRLLERITHLQEELQVQTKVNTDLKKLLVASMGDDLHHKVDSLVRTRAQLASEIGGYTDRICEDHETLDKVTIQADMWRSKYTASRVLVDKLAEEKEVLTERCATSHRVIQQLLQERKQLRDSMKETHRFLKVVHDAFRPDAGQDPPVPIPNVLELARTNHLLADSIKFRLLPAMPLFPSVLDAGVQDNPTPAEKLANQVLCGDTDHQVVGAVPGRLSSQFLDRYDRFHPHVRYDNITFNCCANCQGEIRVI